MFLLVSGLLLKLGPLALGPRLTYLLLHCMLCCPLTAVSLQFAAVQWMPVAVACARLPPVASSNLQCDRQSVHHTGNLF